MPQDEERRPLLSVVQAAAYLGCSKDHIYDLVDAKLLPGINIGIKASKLRIRPEDLEAFIELRTR